MCVALTSGTWQFEAQSLKLYSIRGQLPDVGLIHTHEDVLRFNVRVDDLTLGVEIVQPFKNL